MSPALLLALYALLTLLLYAMSSLLPRAAFLARSAAAFFSVSAAAALGVLSSAVLTLLGRQHSAQWATARACHHLMRLTTGTYFSVDDPARSLDRVCPAVFVGNHQSELDIVLLAALFPRHCSVTAKSSLRWVPVLGWFMALSGTIFVDRANSADSRSALDAAAAQIAARGQSVFLFPEGTRSYAPEPKLLPFKKGAFHLAVQAGVPIVPCVAANYAHAYSLRAMRFLAGAIPVKVLDPIPTTGLTAADVPDLARRVEELMLEELVALTARARGQPVPVPAALPPTTEIVVDGNPEVAETVETVQVSH